MKPKITKEFIENVLDDISYKKIPIQERKFSMWTGCISKGWVKWTSDSIELCSNDNCPSCKQMKNILKETVNNWKINIDETKDNSQ